MAARKRRRAGTNQFSPFGYCSRQNDPLVPVQDERVFRSAAPNANPCLNSKG